MEENQHGLLPQAFSVVMAIVDLVLGIQYLFEKNSNALSRIAWSFFWLFSALKGLNPWLDRFGWMVWAVFLLLQVWMCSDSEAWKGTLFER